MSRPDAKLVPVDFGDSWERQLILSSIPLKCLTPEKEIRGYASGCLIDYLGHRLVLSVSHATLKSGLWAIELGCWSGDRGMKLLPLPAMNFLGRISTDNLLKAFKEGKLDDLSKNIVDFSYGIIPKETESLHEQFSDNGQLQWKATRTVFKTTLTEKPETGVKYGFSGHTQLEQLPHPTNSQLSVLCATQTICGDLAYLKTEDDVHYFKLPGKHPGHIHFEGCSGAPIIDEQGRVVALVQGGNLDEDTVYGVSLSKYKMAVDIEAGNIPGLPKKAVS